MILEAILYLVCHETESTSFEDAISGPESKECIEVIQSEVCYLEQNKTWEGCYLPPARKAIPIKWDFKRETNAKRKFCRCKARFVCKGFMQR
jgi:hypothetical protein